MPGIRIYAFAKKLGLDNKQLLDICEQVGIKGKGSALASLEEDEVAKVQQFIESGDTGSSSNQSAEPDAPAAPQRNDLAGTRRTSSMVDLDSQAKQQASKLSDETPSAEDESDHETEAVAEGEAGEDSEAKQDAPWHRPQPVKNKIAELGKSGSGSAKKPMGQKKRPALNVKLAKMPDVKQPAPTARSGDEKVQRPEIALPKDGFKKEKDGSAGPLDRYTDKGKDKKGKKKGRGAAPQGGASPAEEMPLSGKKGRRGARAKETERENVDSGLGSTRQQRTRRRRPPNMGDDDRGNYRRRQHRRRSGPVANTAAPRKDNLVLQLPCSVRELSEVAGVPAVQVLLTIRQLGDEANHTINSILDDQYVELLLENFNIENVEVRPAQSLEEAMVAEFEEAEDPESLVPRPPIVTFLGHVDHGKTSLLDAIIGIDVVSGESGGITQHIRAYEIDKNGQKIAFVDTPGHEAFTEMRARGANVTDIAVLVVAADDGVMPQTEEAISHAKAAGVPIVVALNKIDLQGANPEKAFQDLAQHDLLPSEWGGETEVIRTSATQGEGIDNLLETILVTAELHELKANPDRPASGTCIESEQQSDKGVVAKIMVQTGTLRVGDVVVCGSSYGRVKAMHDTLRPKIKLDEAGPSTPVNLTGLDQPPAAGDKFYVLDDIADAREIASRREHRETESRVGSRTVKTSILQFQELMESGSLRDPNAEVVKLNLIIRADTKGSIEAIQKELGKISHPEVQIEVKQALAGGITVGDVRLAEASQAVVIGFNVVPDEAARSLAENLQIEIRRYDIIYKITDDLKAMLEGKLKPEEQVVEQGMAMVLKTFTISRTGTIAGCRVMRGSIQRECRLRVIRESRVIGDYPIDSLKREKDDSKEVQRGMECGIKLVGFNDIKEGDTLEAYKIEEVARTL
ncbi:MAG: translation initiation factor IF-2 [Mariniblastus sp.]|nr:translation initiation factor IF-2 [Mariniblastus sp.]